MTYQEKVVDSNLYLSILIKKIFKLIKHIEIINRYI